MESTDAGWRVDLVFRHHGGRRVLRDHEAGVYAAVFCQERGKAVGKRGIDHALQPALGHVGVFAEGYAQKVHRKRDRLAVECRRRSPCLLGKMSGLSVTALISRLTMSHT